jgi:galactokinase
MGEWARHLPARPLEEPPQWTGPQRDMSDGTGKTHVVVSFAPGRVNLIGDHTDYTGGYAMPMAIQLGTEVRYSPDPDSRLVELTSTSDPEPARVPVVLPEDSFEVAMLLPEWARYVGGVVAALHLAHGGRGEISSDLPLGAGLSSSASLQLALCLALGGGCEPLGGPSLARLAQQAEHLASGVETGILDQLTIASAVSGHAMLLDCRSQTITQVKVPDGAEIVVVHCGVSRSVRTSAYAERQCQCAAVEAELGPLRDATVQDVDRLSDPLLRKRARHVVSENARVLAFASALQGDDLAEAGALMTDSHHSLAWDFEVSLPELDQLVAWLGAQDAVFGARLTGAGMGGCAVALAEPGALAPRLAGRTHWVVRPSAGACLR